MKPSKALPFWKLQVDLADYIKVDAPTMSRYARKGWIPDEFDKRIEQGIKARMKKLNRLANDLGL